MSHVKSPSKHLSIEFLKALQANHYLSPQGKEYAACEVDSLLNEKLNDLPCNWEGIFESKVISYPKNQIITPPPFTFWNRLNYEYRKYIS